MSPNIRYVQYLNPISHTKWNSSYYYLSTQCPSNIYQSSNSTRGIRSRIPFHVRLIKSPRILNFSASDSQHYYCVGCASQNAINTKQTIPQYGWSRCFNAYNGNLYNATYSKWDGPCKSPLIPNSIHINSFITGTQTDLNCNFIIY